MYQDFLYNYYHYAHPSIRKYPNRAVAVIRTEHLWEDVIALDKSLGGTGNFSEAGSRFTHGVEKFAYNTKLSPSDAAFLCCLLHEEMDVYQTVILKAFNLNETEKHETLGNVLTHCRIETRQDLLEDPFSWSAYHVNHCASNEVLLKTK
jgi:hypothetical protein